MLSLLVRSSAAELVPLPLRRRLRRWLNRVLTAAGRPDAGVCLSLSDDAELHSLNLAYAGEDHPTDVLSFALHEARPPGAQPQGPAAPQLLGDIVISVPIAQRQAAERGHGLDAELLHLAVHGFCHLLGYDHATQQEERVMFGYETLLRAQARSRRPVTPQPPPQIRRRRTPRAALQSEVPRG
jgi:probable rRNA maturation factor